MHTSLQVSVGELVSQVLRFGDLGTGFVSPARAQEGIRIHQRLQKSRPSSYTPEVTVAHSVDTPRFHLTISGRIDGVFCDADQVMVEEIKTTVSDLRIFEEHPHPVHWGQLKCYAFIYAHQNDLSEIKGRLTYCRIGTEAICEIDQTFTMVELRGFFEDLVTRFLARAKQLANWRALRNVSIENLDFPFGAYRAGQRQMAVAVYRALRDHSRLMVQAPTGIGKTLAALFPAIKALAENHCAKIFFLAARTTGKLAAHSAISHLRDQGLRIKHLLLTAKEKICFNPATACTALECEYARGHFDRVDQALEAAFDRDDWNREVLQALAREHRVCPFELSLDLAFWADIIICDYNYAFDPHAKLRRFFQDPKEDYVFLIDEAHHLVERARDMFSAQLSKQQVLQTRRRIKAALPLLAESLARINQWFLDHKDQWQAPRQAVLDPAPPLDLVPLLRAFTDQAEAWLAGHQKAEFTADLLDLYFGGVRFLRILEAFDSTYTVCRGIEGQQAYLKLLCLDPGDHLQAALAKSSAAVFFSATLAPGDYFKRFFAPATPIDSLRLPAVFPRENLQVWVNTGIRTFYAGRERTAPQVARAVINLVTGRSPGNYLVFFPSYAYLQLVLEHIQALQPDFHIKAQSPGMGELEREAFLADFRHAPQSVLAGFVVMGGAFAEGIDLVGERLSGAVIVGVGLPAISPERELIRAYFQGLNGRGFAYAYQYPGFNRVLQAAGRVIRSETDKGVVLLIDSRYARPDYQALFPPEWQGACQLPKDR